MDMLDQVPERAVVSGDHANVLIKRRELSDVADRPVPRHEPKIIIQEWYEEQFIHDNISNKHYFMVGRWKPETRNHRRRHLQIEIFSSRDDTNAHSDNPDSCADYAPGIRRGWQLCSYLHILSTISTAQWINGLFHYSIRNVTFILWSEKLPDHHGTVVFIDKETKRQSETFTDCTTNSYILFSVYIYLPYSLSLSVCVWCRVSGI